MPKKKSNFKRKLKSLFSRERVKKQKKKRKGREKAMAKGMERTKVWIKKPKRERVIAEGTF